MLNRLLYSFLLIQLFALTRPTKGAELLKECNSDAGCPAHASCQSRWCYGKICLCDNSFTPSHDEKSCILGRNLKETCNSQSRCSIPQSECLNGTCQCHDGHTVANASNINLLVCVPNHLDNVKVAVLGQSCDDVSTKCVGEYVTCADSMCRCEDGYRSSTLEEMRLFPFVLHQCIPESFKPDRTVNITGECPNFGIPTLPVMPISPVTSTSSSSISSSSLSSTTSTRSTTTAPPTTTTTTKKPSPTTTAPKSTTTFSSSTTQLKTSPTTTTTPSSTSVMSSSRSTSQSTSSTRARTTSTPSTTSITTKPSSTEATTTSEKTTTQSALPSTSTTTTATRKTTTLTTTTSSEPSSLSATQSTTTITSTPAEVRSTSQTTTTMRPESKSTHTQTVASTTTKQSTAASSRTTVSSIAISSTHNIDIKTTTVHIGGKCGTCPINADCEPDSCNVYRCRCKLGYANNPDKTECWQLSALGEDCTNNKICQGPFTVCDGVCKCADEYEPSDNGRWCRLKESWFIKFPLLEEQCSGGLTSDCYMEFEQSCVDGRCRCKSGQRGVDDDNDDDRKSVYPGISQCRNSSLPKGYRPRDICEGQSRETFNSDIYDRAKSKIRKMQGAIIGGSIGGVALIGIVVGIIALARWKRRERRGTMRDTSSMASTEGQRSRYSFKIPRPFTNYVSQKEYDSNQISYPNTALENDEANTPRSELYATVNNQMIT